MKITTKLWVGIIVLIILSPLGIYLPEAFRAGSAWGEWGAEEIKELAGYVPQGLARLSEIWSAPIPDYLFKGWENANLGGQSAGYIASAIIGIGLTVCVVLLLGSVMAKNDK